MAAIEDDGGSKTATNGALPEEYYAHCWPVLEWPFERRVELFSFEKSWLKVSDPYKCLVRNALLTLAQY